MEYKITGYEPAALFRNFEDFSAVPRGSFHNEKVSDFLVKFAKDRGLEVYQDEALNVIIKKPGQNGGEGKAPVILQGHMDMVCEKVHGCDHDFETQGIDMYVTEDGWLTANGTTLGGDDGIADATMMTL
ncbi:MAG: aminoacyl-histidine dipeptidase, partial [Clostridia bacterium]|nr:aminoacyl-histidine dipeptidase [Clostridia bacterium]